MPRKCVEPKTLAAGTAVRTLQEFLVTAHWDHQHEHDLLQSHVAKVIADLPPERWPWVLPEVSSQCLVRLPRRTLTSALHTVRPRSPLFTPGIEKFRNPPCFPSSKP